MNGQFTVRKIKNMALEELLSYASQLERIMDMCQVGSKGKKNAIKCLKKVNKERIKRSKRIAKCYKGIV